jgi:hypothetical protein
MGVSGGPDMIQDGLVLALDAGDRNSYPGSGTTWRDLSGYSNNGVLTNGPTFNSANGGSIVFDGVDDILYSSFIQNTALNFTVEVCAKSNTMDNNDGNRQTLWSFNTGTNGYQLLDLEIWGNNANSFNGNGTNFTGGPVAVDYNISVNNIHTYTLVSSANVFYWYIDSNFKTSYAPTYTGTSTYFKLATRGADALGTGQQWNGLIYSAKIYNRALTSTEILQNYNAQKSRFNL